MGKVQGRNVDVSAAFAKKITEQLMEIVTLVTLILGPQETAKQLRGLADEIERLGNEG